MKKFLAMLVVAAAMTSVVGCGDAPAPTPTKTTPPAPGGMTKPADSKK
jgi:hypothetical protein